MPQSQPLDIIAPLDLGAERRQVGADIQRAVANVLDSGQYVLGPEVARFEDDFARFQHSAHAVGVASGTDALVLALRALDVGPGDLVLTSPFTFFASAGSIAWVGARPVFCDVDPETALIDPQRARDALVPGVKGILPVHLYGQLADLRGFRELADEKGLFLLEDAAQAHGAERDGARAGEVGELATFSFYPTKNLGTAGEGGAVLTPRDDLAERLRRLRDHGSPRKYTHAELGTNSRLEAIQAAVLNAKLPHLEAWNARRREIAASYDAAFSSGPVKPLRVAEGSVPVYHQYTVRVPGDRDGFLSHLEEQGVRAAVHYPTPVHRQPVAQTFLEGGESFPEAEALAREVVCLPVHPFLTPGHVERVVAAVRGWNPR